MVVVVVGLNRLFVGILCMGFVRKEIIVVICMIFLIVCIV